MRQNDFDNKDIKDNLQFCVILSSPRSTPVTYSGSHMIMVSTEL